MPLALMAVIAWLSHRPLPSGVAGGPDKLVHAAVWAVLAACWWYALAGGRLGRGVRAAIVLAICIGWGVFDEWHQSFVPGRDASGADTAADAVGAVLGTWASSRRGVENGS